MENEIDSGAAADASSEQGDTPYNANLASIFRAISYREDTGQYDLRNNLVYEAVSTARMIGLPAGFRLDPEEPEWPVAFIELPGEGQVSWHVPQHAEEWDGHTTEEKYERARSYCKQTRREQVIASRSGGHE